MPLPSRGPDSHALLAVLALVGYSFILGSSRLIHSWNSFSQPRVHLDSSLYFGCRITTPRFSHRAVSPIRVLGSLTTWNLSCWFMGSAISRPCVAWGYRENRMWPCNTRHYCAVCEWNGISVYFHFTSIPPSYPLSTAFSNAKLFAKPMGLYCAEPPCIPAALSRVNESSAAN